MFMKIGFHNVIRGNPHSLMSYLEEKTKALWADNTALWTNCALLCPSGGEERFIELKEDCPWYVFP